MKPGGWLLLALAALALFAGLSRGSAGASSGGMKTIAKPAAKKTVRKAAVRKAVKKTRAPVQTRAEFVAEIKAIAARVDAGKERTYSAEEVERELGL